MSVAAQAAAGRARSIADGNRQRYRHSLEESVRYARSERAPGLTVLDSAVHIPEEIYQAGDLRIDVGRHQVTRDGGLVPLPNLSFELLLALVRAHPRMLTTEELLDSVWAPAVVNPETVGQRVKLLRQALGDDARAPRYIVGVRGRGYRMDVPVAREANDPQHRVVAADVATVASMPQSPAQSAAPSRRTRAAPELLRLSRTGVALAAALAILTVAGLFWRLGHEAIEPKASREAPFARGKTTEPATPHTHNGLSLAVLPFLDMSPQHDQQYFSDGLAEELLNQLAQVPSLRVIGRTSSFAFRGRDEDLRRIGEILDVNHVLEGSVRKSGNRVRIAVQLIDSSDGSSIWSHTYERTLDDIFAIQEEIGRAVATELQVRIDNDPTARGATRNYAAFDEFLTARALLNSNDSALMKAAGSHLEKAVGLDPGYLDAWIWLIDSYTRQEVGNIERRADIKAAQLRAIEKVSALAPESLYAAIAKSYGALSNGDLQSAGRLLQSTLNAPAGIRGRVRMRYGQFLLSVGSATGAVDQLTQTRAADPLDVFLRTQVLLALDVSGQRDRADAEAAELRQLPGGDAVLLQGDQVTRAMDRGDRDAVKAALAEKGGGLLANDGLRGRLVAALEDPPVARAALQRTLDDPHAAADVFTMTSAMEWAAFLGEPQLALRAADKAVDAGVSFETWAWTIWRPVMKEVRREPEFKALVQKMGLVDYWRATGNWGDFCKPVGGNDFQCT